LKKAASAAFFYRYELTDTVRPEPAMLAPRSKGERR
jgi:hypothetical protein